MIQIKEAQVSWFRPLKFWVSVSLNIKEEDLTKQERDLIEEYWKNGDSVVVVLQPFTKPYQTKERSKASTLHHFMQQYCEKFNIPLETERDRILQRYSIKYDLPITSRSQLKEKDLDFEIDSYSAWLLL